MGDVRDWVALNLIPGVGPRSFLKLLSVFRSPDRILSANERELAEVLGQNREIAQRIANYRDVVDVENELKLVEQHNATVITLEDPRYPPSAEGKDRRSHPPRWPHSGNLSSGTRIHEKEASNVQ